MSRPRKPARLYYRKAKGHWVIRDGNHESGAVADGEGNRDAAEQALGRYIAERAAPIGSPRQPSEVAVGDMLFLYASYKSENAAAPERIAYAIKRLAPYWGELTCDAVKGATCRAYAKRRTKDGVSTATSRRELGVLQAALNHGHAEGALLYAPKVSLPDHGKSRDRALSRDEVAKLIRAARNGRSPHLARFILIAVYTGTRAGAIFGLRWGPSLDSGWVDTAAGVIHRKGARQAETKKRRGAVRMPRRLARLMAYWERRGGSHVVSWNGDAIKDIGKALDGACARSGVDRCTPHELKHTAVTWAFRNGMTQDAAAEFFDTTAATLQTVYRQHSPHYQADAAEIMERKR